MREEKLPLHGAEEITGSDDRTGAIPQLTIALAWVAAREARNRVFGNDLFIDPAWDMLLNLYIDHARGQRVSVTNVCIASGAPTTTGLRWIAALELHGLVSRLPDQQDRRRTFIELTPLGIAQMDAALLAATASDARYGLGRLRLIDERDKGLEMGGGDS